MITNTDKAKIIIEGLEHSGGDLSNDAAYIVSLMLDILDNPPLNATAESMERWCVAAVQEYIDGN